MSVGSSQVQKHQLYAALQSHTEEGQTEKKDTPQRPTWK